MSKKDFILFGAGSAGRYALKFLREHDVEPLCFADNDETKIGTFINGVMVTTPAQAFDEWASREPEWIATAISRPAAPEIRAEMATIGVKTKPLWECIPVHHGLPPENIRETLFPAIYDVASSLEFNDQCIFRKNPDYDRQDHPSPKEETYFPDFIKHIDEEVFVDVGAADGDTVMEFMKRRKMWKRIVAIEPDSRNFSELSKIANPHDRVTKFNMAVSDFDGATSFASFGDYSSHIDSTGLTNQCTVKKLDSVAFSSPPTYIKMDVEGSELEALWGARKLIKEHSPVLAICAYHKSDDLWSIPLLIHALNPDYQLFLRRYGEGAFEIVWYGVPLERVKL